ncbi:MAG: hypothetical protein WCQ64_15285 [Acidobacteriota bacterium]
MTDWKTRAQTADEAVKLIKSGMRIFIHGASATPSALLEALVRRTDLSDVTLYHLHTNGPAPFVDPVHAGRFFSVSLFTGPAVRQAISEGRADYVPVFLSDIPLLFSSGRVKIDVAFLQLSPPDAHGYCTLGTSVDAALAASRAARHIVAEINVRMPRTHGNTLVPFSAVTSFVASDRPIYEVPRPVITPVEDAIGEQVARLVPDRATLERAGRVTDSTGTATAQATTMSQRSRVTERASTRASALRQHGHRGGVRPVSPREAGHR